MTGGSGGASSWERASAVPLFMIRWCLDGDLLSPEFKEEHASRLSECKNGSMTLFEFYEGECDMVFASDMLSEEGNAFARDYFEYETGRFVADLWAALGHSGNDYPLYTDADYMRVKPIIDSRYAAWKAGDIETVREARGKSWPPWIKKTLGILILVGMIAFLFLLMWFLSKYVASHH